MKTTTKNAACNQAISETSALSRFGGQWKFTYFDPTVNAWRESTSTEYWQACNHRRRRLIERAREIMRPEEIDGHQYESGDLMGGKWQSYV